MYRIMVIDDEPSARRLLKASADWRNYQMDVVGEAQNGIEAINTIDEYQPDLAFVDINMPFMNGIEFTRLANERYPDLLIIILTAYDEFEYARQCIRLNVFEYLLKPFSRDELNKTLERARKYLDGRKKTEEKPGPEIELSTIEKVRQYLQNNYTDSTINLTGVAQKFGFNSSYLSRKFKVETGKSFVDFLTERRIERARELAAEGAMLYSVAASVGIPDPNYFGRCFKKYTGINYSEYAVTVRGKKLNTKGEQTDGPDNCKNKG